MNCYAAAVKTVLESSYLDLVVVVAAAADPVAPIHYYPAPISTMHQGYDPVPDVAPVGPDHTPSLFSFDHRMVVATQALAEVMG